MQGVTDTRVGVGLGQYAGHYDFEVRKPLVDRVEELKAALCYEGSKLRRGVFKRELWWEEVSVLLGGEILTLPLEYQGQGGFWDCKQNGLYLGGIEKKVEIRLHWGRDLRQVWVEGKWMHDSVYVGPMPEWVQEKYQRARKVFPKGDLLVASRNEAFFDYQVVVPGSPLLLAMDRKRERQILLAAWGLEYELPKSLGGLSDA